MTEKKTKPAKKAQKTTKPTPVTRSRSSSEYRKTGIKKEYLKTKKVCRVTFRLPRVAAPDAKTVCIVGEFNDWNIYATPMKKLKSGDHTITLELEPGREYQFRYLVDGSTWENDWNADKYVKNPYGDSDNSVIVV